MADGHELGGYIEAPVQDTAAWYEHRLANLKLIEIRGRVKKSEDTSAVGMEDASPAEEAEEDEQEATAEQDDEGGEADSEDRKQYGPPRFISLADGRRIDTTRGTVPKKSTVACGFCGHPADCLEAVKTYTLTQKSQRSAPVAAYTIQGYCPECNAKGHIYDGRFFAAPSAADVARLVAAEREWVQRREADLKDWWPRSRLPHTWMTHHLNGGIPNWGYTHWHMMFNPRQLLVHSTLLSLIAQFGGEQQGDH